MNYYKERLHDFGSLYICLELSLTSVTIKMNTNDTIPFNAVRQLGQRHAAGERIGCEEGIA